MNKDYVSFEAARLLREKGYNNLNECYYNRYGAMCARHEGKVLKEGEYMAPRLDEACRWLREEKGTHIVIIPEYSKEAFSVVYGFDVIQVFDYETGQGYSHRDEFCRRYNSYEACLDRAVSGSLRLL